MIYVHFASALCCSEIRATMTPRTCLVRRLADHRGQTCALHRNRAEFTKGQYINLMIELASLAAKSSEDEVATNASDQDS